jgi:hypothetical protein
MLLPQPQPISRKRDKEVESTRRTKRGKDTTLQTIGRRSGCVDVEDLWKLEKRET